jgi:hypothetical protein
MRVDARRLHFFDLETEAAIGLGEPAAAVPDPAPAATLEG